MSSEFLAFAAHTGVEPDVYDLFFSTVPESVWGDGWEVTPAVIAQPVRIDPHYVSSFIRARIALPMSLACENSWFSMQDCIDGIIPLAFSGLDGEFFLKDGAPMVLRFGTPKDEVKDMVLKYGADILGDAKYVSEESGGGNVEKLADEEDEETPDTDGPDDDIDNFDW